MLSAMSDPGVNSITSFDRSTLLDKLGGEEAFMLGLLAVALRSNAGMPVELAARSSAAEASELNRALADAVERLLADLRRATAAGS